MTELDPDARRLLDLTRDARTPSARDRARVDRMLAASLLLTSSAHAGTAAAATKTAGTALGVKWAAGVVIAAAIGSASYVGWNATQAPSPEKASTTAVSRLEPVRDTAPVNTASQVTLPEVPVPPSDTRAERRVESSKVTTEKSPAESTLLEELNLLHEAQAKWRKGDAAGALSLLSQHQKRYPRSQVGQEREALTVLSLCSMGRAAEARKVAQRFLRTAPRSPLRTSVEESCGGSSLK